MDFHNGTFTDMLQFYFGVPSQGHSTLKVDYNLSTTELQSLITREFMNPKILGLWGVR
jgi:hypothetical protein